jgi:aminocarboxymuconate-semialdehyde decarboxylase
MTYDVHAHCVPDAVLASIRADGGRYGLELVSGERGPAVRIAGREPTGPLREDLSDRDIAARLAAMDAAGVGVQLLSSWIDLTAYALEPAAGARYARMFNDALAAVVAAHPDRFRALGTVPLQDPPAAAAELRRGVSELGLVGAEIATTVDGTELDDPELAPFWDAASDLGCLVLLHPFRSLAGRGLNRYFLGNLVGNPAESTIAAAHLVLGGVLERFPGLQVCLVHGGGFLPYQIGRLDRGYAAKAELVAGRSGRAPSAWLRRLYFDTVVHSPAALAYLVDVVGADRVLLGSDYPFEMGEPDPVGLVQRTAGLDEAARHAILEGNVSALLASIGS